MSSTETQFKHAISICRYYRIKKMVKKWIKKAKNSIYRKKVLEEWVKTQAAYIEDLKIIDTKIKQPIRKQKLLEKEQIEIVFVNLEAIIRLSGQILKVLQQFQKNWKATTIEIAPEIIKFCNYFIIYKNYCNNFAKSQNIMKKIKNKPELTEIQQTLKMDIESYLIKPVQRPPKYMLLLRDYQKHMSVDHKDYNNLTIAIEKYHVVNEVNNEAMQKEARNQKMFSLSKIYEGLLISTRQYIKQFQANLIADKNLKLYVFNDLLMVTAIIQQVETLEKLVFLDDSSFCEIYSDGKYYKNKLFVCGRNDCIHVFFYNKQQAKAVYECIVSVINKIWQKQNQRWSLMENYYNKAKPQSKVRVTLSEGRDLAVVFLPKFKITYQGVQKRPVSMVSNPTFYILKFELQKPWKMVHYNYMSYDVVDRLLEYIRKRNLLEVDFPNLNPVRDMGFYNSKKNGTQIIEIRAVVLEEVVNYVLRNSRIMYNPTEIITLLQIQPHLWEFAIDDLKEKCTCKLCYNDKEPASVDAFMKQREYYIKNSQKLTKVNYCTRRYISQISTLLTLDIKQFNTYQKMLVWLNLYENRIDYSRLFLTRSKEFEDQINVYLLNIEEQVVKVKISKQNTVGEVIDKICRQFNIMQMEDFGLFVYYSDVPRLLDNDENMNDVRNQLQNQSKEPEQERSFFQNLFSKGQQMLIGKKSKFYLRKYFYVNLDVELKTYFADHKRFKLVIDQLIYAIKTEEIKVNEEELLQIAGLYWCLVETDKIQYISSNNFPKDRLKKMFPSSKTSLLNDRGWIQKLYGVVQTNKNQILKLQDRFLVIYELLFMILKLRTQYWVGSLMYEVDVHDPAVLEGQNNALLAINYYSICVLNKKSKKCLKVFKFKNLQFSISASSIYLYDDRQYRFNGKLLYSVGRIIQKYKLLNQFFPEMTQAPTYTT